MDLIPTVALRATFPALDDPGRATWRTTNQRCLQFLRPRWPQTNLDRSGKKLMPVNEERLIQGNLIQILTNSKAEAVRAVQRLHRNLGHPSTTALVEMLESRGASEMILSVAREYQCQACLRYKKPNQVAPAAAKAVLKFNQSIQADVMWIKSGENKFPVLSVVDEGTKYQAAQLVNGQSSDDFIQALERHWVAHFGPPQRLVTDEGRGWLGIQFERWSDEQGIHHVVAAGEAHEQLALVERRHAVLRKAIDIFLLDHGVDGASAQHWSMSSPR